MMSQIKVGIRKNRGRMAASAQLGRNTECIYAEVISPKRATIKGHQIFRKDGALRDLRRQTGVIKIMKKLARSGNR